MTHSVSASTDPIWQGGWGNSKTQNDRVSEALSLVFSTVMDQPYFEGALTNWLVHNPACPEMDVIVLRDVFTAAAKTDSSRDDLVHSGLGVVLDCDHVSYHIHLLYFKGFLPIRAAWAAHALWSADRPEMATFLQTRVSNMLAAEIYPAVRISFGLVIDQLIGVAVVKIAAIGSNVSILHCVTLGGIGSGQEDWHRCMPDRIVRSPNNHSARDNSGVSNSSCTAS